MSDKDGYEMLASPFKSNHFAGSTAWCTYLYRSTNGVNGFSEADDYLETWCPGGYCCGHYPQSCPSTVGVGPTTLTHPTQPGVVYVVRIDNWENQNVFILRSTDYGVSYSGCNNWRTFSQPVPFLGPISMAISSSSPNTMILNLGNGEMLYYHPTYNLKSRLLKSTNGGLNWHDEEHNNPITPIITAGERGVPDRYFTDVQFDPTNENILYMTMAGYYYPDPDSGHVWRSTDGGYNWTNISVNLPDVPVNKLMIHFPDCITKRLIIATDNGIYSADDVENIQWKLLADGFPHTTSQSLDYNRLSGKLRAGTWGRGIWEFQLEGTEDPIYVQDELFITDNTNINRDIIICPGGKLTLGHESLNQPFTLTFASGKGIIVQDGGSIETPSTAEVTLMGDNWSGIQILGNTSSAVLKNCTFTGSITPLVVSGNSSGETAELLVQDCTFENAHVEISNRKHVKIYGCTWNYSGQNGVPVCGVAAVGANYLEITGCSVNYLENFFTTGFEIYQSDFVTILSNNIDKTSVAILASNCLPYIKDNNVTNSVYNASLFGIRLDNCVDGNLIGNTITDYQVGFHMENYTSPLMLENHSVSQNNTASNVNSGMYCGTTSAPRLAPTITPEGVIWDAGKNELKSNDNGAGIHAEYRDLRNAEPVLYQGCNDIFGAYWYLFGGNIITLNPIDWHVEGNAWIDNPPYSDKFSVTWATVFYDPWGCPFGEGGGIPIRNYELGIKNSEVPLEMEDMKPEILNPEDPPAPVIVDYGTGFPDTLDVTTATVQLPADWAMLASANNQIMLNQFQTAVATLQQQIQTYHDSASSKFALKRLFYCYSRMGADTSSFSGLRNYYLSVASSYSTDTALVRTAEELSRKCLVKVRQLPPAVGEYESVVQNSQDSTEILSAEINIIEIYLLMGNQGGNAPSFTGQLAYLKPANLRDGIRMLHSKMFKFTQPQKKATIPHQFELSQNYPNPFNAKTVIRYQLPVNSVVTLKVYDILGRLVREVVNERQDAGYYRVEFDATNLSSGVYFYRLEAGEFVATKKLVVIK